VRDRFSVIKLCRRFGVTSSGYYAWRGRWASDHQVKDVELRSLIRQFFDDSRGVYGSPRLHALLQHQGIRVSRKRVVRLMKQDQLKARAARVYRRVPGSKSFFCQVPNRLPEKTTRQDQVWVADITFLRLPGRYHFLATVMDKHSRRIVGWSLSRQRTVPLTLTAFNRAMLNRRPPPGLIFHTDRGIEFAAYAFRDHLARLGVVQSMNRPKNMNDNAHMESFYHSLKSEELAGRRFETEEQLASAIRSYTQRYNTRRLHSSLGYRSPIDYERLAA
jgi:putative transposase